MQKERDNQRTEVEHLRVQLKDLKDTVIELEQLLQQREDDVCLYMSVSVW